MDDLGNYRARVGSFVQWSRGTILHSTPNYSKLRGVLAYTLVFLTVTGLIAEAMINDPGIEIHPGPTYSQSQKVSSTPAESTLFRKIKEASNEIARLSSHRFFNRTCIDLKLTPKTLQHEIKFTPAKPNPDILAKLTELKNSYTTEALQAFNRHYTTVIAAYQATKDADIAKLKEECEPEKFDTFLKIINSHYDHTVNQLQTRKCKKINALLDVNNNCQKWIPSLQLTTIERDFISNGEQICDNIINASLSLLMRINPLLHIQSTTMKSSMLQYCPTETIHVHHNNANHFVTSSSLGNQIKLFDSANMSLTPELKNQITAIYSPDDSIPEIFRAKIQAEQSGSTDCGLFAIAFATDLAFGNNPSSIAYDQANMRTHLQQCLEMENLTPFPRRHHQTLMDQETLVNLTADIPDTDKWTKAKKTSSPIINDRHNSTTKPVSTSNRFSSLEYLTDDSNIDLQSITTAKEKQPDSDSVPKTAPLYSPEDHQVKTQAPTNLTPSKSTITNSDSCGNSSISSSRSYNSSSSSTNSNQSTYIVVDEYKSPSSTAIGSPIMTSTPRVNPSKPSSKKKSSPIINLSSRVLNADEKKVLELGLSWCPSVQHFNKEQLAEDFYMFIRRLKLTEYFHDKPSAHYARLQEPAEDQSSPKYSQPSSDWYPDEVRNHRSPALVDFIDSMLRDTKRSLSSQANVRWNNMDNKSRAAIVSLANDKSIIIKPSDKCGSIVIMNRTDYEAEALKQLTNTDYYEELKEDPNPKYKEELVQIIGQQNEMTLSEQNIVLQGESTPAFYGLPKCHKTTTANEFPPLRPISSGHSSCTANLSRYLDSFLKCAAQKTASYIQDTTHFINRLADIRLPAENNHTPILVSMDVVSLYPNIHQQEGADACHHYMEQRTEKSISSGLIKKLILFVLRSHTMNFLNRYFHQIKGTAMGTSMAVNFANLFMAKFEEDLLHTYKTKYNMEPVIWLRFIDDVFFIWNQSEESLQHFLEHCNNFASEQSMSSTIKFTYSYSRKSVNFLDTTISLASNGTLSTTLYSKPTAAHNYLHNRSYHYPKAIRSIPKSQFIRIRRICTSLHDYWTHANQFITFFANRGYNQANLSQCAKEIATYHRQDLLKEKPKQTEEAKRIPLVISWHHKFKGISDVLHHQYERIARSNATFKEVFPQPPIIAYRRAKNNSDRIVRANHWGKKNLQTAHTKTKSMIDSNMNTFGSICNPKTGRSANIPIGSATDSNVIYAAKCKKHQVLYVGTTGGQLNTRFSGHRSDIKHYPSRCELPKHFRECGCDFSMDLEVSVLEHVKGGVATRLLKEDKWIRRLDTVSPNGLNERTSEFGSIHQHLF